MVVEDPPAVEPAPVAPLAPLPLPERVDDVSASVPVISTLCPLCGVSSLSLPSRMYDDPEPPRADAPAPEVPLVDPLPVLLPPAAVLPGVVLPGAPLVVAPPDVVLPVDPLPPLRFVVPLAVLPLPEAPLADDEPDDTIALFSMNWPDDDDPEEALPLVPVVLPLAPPRWRHPVIVMLF